MNPTSQFIQIAPDSPTRAAIVPQEKDGKRSIASIEYELLIKSPYHYTLEELKFATHIQHKLISSSELKAHRQQLWEEYFSKPHACMRASPLTKKYGWSAYYDANGKIAIYPAESIEYMDFVANDGIKKHFAMRTKRTQE
jgi:hypothetical protein